MANYRIEKDDHLIIIWDDDKKLGLQFKEGESLQRYECSMVMDSSSTCEDLGTISEVYEELLKYAEKMYPEEFIPLKMPKAVYFVKNFPDEDYSVGRLTGEPNKDGEQDYEGFSINPTSFYVIHEAEDFLSIDDILDLNNGYKTRICAIGENVYNQIEELYQKTEKALFELGYTKEGLLSLEEMEDIENEDNKERASVILTNAIEKAIELAEGR